MGIYWTDYCLVIPFKVMVNNVFKNVVDKVIFLLARQMKKIGGSVKATFLVGGLGCNPYLKRRILQEFTATVDMFKRDPNMHKATMTGAAYYGIASLKRPEQIDIAEISYKDDELNPIDYDTLVCIGNSFIHSTNYINITIIFNAIS